MKAEGCSALERENMIPELAAICSDKKQANKVLFSTVRKFKGLEADVVICIDVDEGTFANEINRSLFYVGTSRAKTWLDILTTVSQESLATAVTGEDVPRKRPPGSKSCAGCALCQNRHSERFDDSGGFWLRTMIMFLWCGRDTPMCQVRAFESFA